MRIRPFLAVATCVVLTVSLAACGNDDPTGPPPATAPSQLEVVDGDDQAGALGQPRGEPVVIRAVDADGPSVAGVAVAFAVQSGGGSVQPASATTGSDGRVQASWTLGGSPGEQQLAASADGVATVTVTAEAFDLAICGSINADHALRDVGHPYVLCSAGASVTGGATLEIEPGITIIAEAGALLRIQTDGVLHAVGSETDTIRVVGATAEPGFWHGIWHESELEGNELAWVEIAHGGGSGVSAGNPASTGSTARGRSSPDMLVALASPYVLVNARHAPRTPAPGNSGEPGPPTYRRWAMVCPSPSPAIASRRWRR